MSAAAYSAIALLLPYCSELRTELTDSNQQIHKARITVGQLSEMADKDMKESNHRMLKSIADTKALQAA